MAYVSTPMDDEELKNGQIVTSGQESGVVTGAPVAAGASQAQTSGWVNFDKYLKANEGQGQAIAGAVTQGADTAIKSSAEKLNEFENKAKTQDQTQTAKLNETAQAIKTDPTKVDLNAYQTQMSAGYGGPTQAGNVQGYGDAYKAWGGAKEKYDAIKDDSAAGRQAAVTSTYKPQAQNGYTKGMGLLDSFVLSGDAAGKKALSDFTNNNASINTALEDTSKRAQGYLDSQKAAFTQAQAGVKQSVKDKQQAVVGGISAKQGDLDSRNRLLDERQDVLSAVMSEVSRASGKNLDPSKFFESTGRYSIGDITSDDERATLEALNNLSDSDSRVDVGAYKPQGQAGVKVSQDAIKSALGYDYDAERNSLVALTTDGGNGVGLTHDLYYKKLIQDALKAKGYT